MAILSVTNHWRHLSLLQWNTVCDLFYHIPVTDSSTASLIKKNKETSEAKQNLMHAQSFFKMLWSWMDGTLKNINVWPVFCHNQSVLSMPSPFYIFPSFWLVGDWFPIRSPTNNSDSTRTARKSNNLESQIPDSTENKWPCSTNGRKRWAVFSDRHFREHILSIFTWLAQDASVSLHSWYSTDCILGTMPSILSYHNAKHCCPSMRPVLVTRNIAKMKVSFTGYRSWIRPKFVNACCMRAHMLAIGLDISWPRFSSTSYYAVLFRTSRASSVVREALRAHYQRNQPATNWMIRVV